MAKNRYQPNHQFERQFGRSTDMRKLVEAPAKRAAADARGRAPVGRSGNYRDGIKGEAVMSPKGWVGRVNAYDWKSAIIELHGVNDGRGPLGVLRKAVEGQNLRFRGGRG